MIWPPLTFSASPPASSPCTFLRHKTAYGCSHNWEVTRLLFAPSAGNILLTSPSPSLDSSCLLLKPEIRCHLLPDTIPAPLLTLNAKLWALHLLPEYLEQNLLPYLTTFFFFFCNNLIMCVLPVTALSSVTSSMWLRTVCVCVSWLRLVFGLL